MTSPAYVQGNERQAIAVFIEDRRGDLVDIEFYCRFDQCGEGIDLSDCLPYPAYDFSPDYDTCCNECGQLINKGDRT